MLTRKTQIVLGVTAVVLALTTFSDRVNICDMGILDSEAVEAALVKAIEAKRIFLSFLGSFSEESAYFTSVCSSRTNLLSAETRSVTGEAVWSAHLLE